MNDTNNEVPHFGAFPTFYSHPSWFQIFASRSCFKMPLICIWRNIEGKNQCGQHVDLQSFFWFFEWYSAYSHVSPDRTVSLSSWIQLHSFPTRMTSLRSIYVRTSILKGSEYAGWKFAQEPDIFRLKFFSLLNISNRTQSLKSFPEDLWSGLLKNSNLNRGWTREPWVAMRAGPWSTD